MDVGFSLIGSSSLTGALLEPTAFKPAETIDLIVPDHSGLYAIRVRDTSALPEPFRSHNEKRGHDLLYIGVATRCLSRRFLHQELRAHGHGTFFRSLGAILGYRPPAGSLVGKGSTRNYRFAPEDRQAIIEWINVNLLVNWVEYFGAHALEETTLIKDHLPFSTCKTTPQRSPSYPRLEPNASGSRTSLRCE